MSAHKVLIPLDDSRVSRQILSQIRRFLNPNDNELILFHVALSPQRMTAKPTRPAAIEWPLPMYASHHDVELAKHPIYASQMQDGLVAQIEEEFRADMRWLQEAGYIIAMVIRFGDPVQEILDFTAEEKVDLVVMTSHDRAGLNRLIFGSVADQVLRKVSVPVLLLRPVE